ncbi:TonB-dependent receptor [Panacibacter ginsenosidivorans]|uniref:TonB-dependent receptor n=1 Tax=Panacibacter ginsenosidivorans TaxID=1813871 RepID=A0A5B8VAA1_9BACT|nr:TonB-dependent receptor [Panacibacter ginsenosidivorans]QEC68374.1 TonB-dependent receptor [Panacibacter ginsenosidivorans]
MKYSVKNRIGIFVFCFFQVAVGKAQNVTQVASADTVLTGVLDSVVVNSFIRTQTFLSDVNGVQIFAGKKTNTVQLNPNGYNLAQNVARNSFAQIPGLTMWDMDGAGTQLNIGSRGTDSHRSIEMNMRQNGYCTNSDIFGYPENHYTVPLQAVQEVQLVRGSAALQYGPQFGGMMNFVMRKGDSTKPFEIQSEQTTGSNNLFNSYNAIGGTKGKLNYYAYFDYRHGDGWRDNAKFNYHAYYINLDYHFNSKASLAFQFSRMDYVQQIAGGLTDAQFAADPKQSERSRNFFQPVINIPALLFRYKLNEATSLEITSHGLFGERNSVQFINTANIADTFNLALNSYNPRQVDRDYYSAFTTEARILHQYKLGNVKSTLAAGLRYFTELTKRKQKGVGTTGSDFDLSLANDYGINLRLTTHNYAAFAENIFQLTPKFSVTPGIRYEIIKTDLDGVINNAADAVAYKSKRNFPLFGAGVQYQATPLTQLYGNISQAYRPYLYANVTPADRIDKIDPSLKDSKGYDIDLGYRGRVKNIFRFDVNAFYLFYGDRVGLITQQDNAGDNFLFTTNIGNSVSKGVEAYVELSLLRLVNARNNKTDLRLFNSLAYTHATYTSGVINKSGVNTSVAGNYVENIPAWNNKCGIDFRVKNISTSLQYSYTSKTYNDAFNTEYSSNGVLGAIPAYHVWDWNFGWQFAKAFRFSGGVNNLANAHYFNRRITFYPGPGILPADGRTFYIGLGMNM